MKLRGVDTFSLRNIQQLLLAHGFEIVDVATGLFFDQEARCFPVSYRHTQPIIEIAFRIDLEADAPDHAAVFSLPGVQDGTSVDLLRVIDPGKLFMHLEFIELTKFQAQRFGGSRQDKTPRIFQIIEFSCQRLFRFLTGFAAQGGIVGMDMYHLAAAVA